MNKTYFIKGLKILLITLLVIAIGLLAIIQWKSDVIINSVMTSVQHELKDSLHYSEVELDWFRHFPSATIRIHELQLGPAQNRLIADGQIDFVLQLFPLLKDEIIIKQLQLRNSSLRIIHQDGLWSYEVLKKSDASSSSSSFNTQIQNLVIENTSIHYDDGKNLRFQFDIEKAKINGTFLDQQLNTVLNIQGSLSEIHTPQYIQPQSFLFGFNGTYSHNLKSGLQQFVDWQISHEGIDLEAHGTIRQESDHELVGMEILWKNAKPEILKNWLPEKWLKTWKAYTLSGESEGQVSIRGKSSQKDTPHISCSGTLKKGGVDFQNGQEKISGLQLDMQYENDNPATKQKSFLEIGFSKGSLFGSSLEGKIHVVNLQKPVLTASVKGSLPAGIFNLFPDIPFHFTKGNFDIDYFELKDVRTDRLSMLRIFSNVKASLTSNDLVLEHPDHKLEWRNGKIQIQNGNLKLDTKMVRWNKATATDLKVEMGIQNDQLDFKLEGLSCGGKIKVDGVVNDIERRPLCVAQWNITSIEMRDLLASFSNFEQTFITSDQLSGKANIWVESFIPFDSKWNIQSKQVVVKSALDIQDGRLVNMKALEDFGRYVHLDDLKDIRFSQIRNYMKIENEMVYLPVMFIQSNAINLSISGVHRFDQKILYNIKLNAGQVISNKLKKSDHKKDVKQARKSGWINMYFVLDGSADAVRYEQNRLVVISGFEQSALLKENLRNELVEKFGYDVYWLEPNEWEEIPEYR